MEKLTKFEEKVLVVLNNLQYLCDVVESYKPNTKEGIEYSFSDMFPPIKGQEELEYVIQYLSKNGLDISITFDTFNDDPSELVFIKKYGEIDNVPLGLIKGKNIEAIKKVIQENIDKLEGVKLEKKEKSVKHLDANEDIELKTLDIIIHNNFMIYRKKKSKKINFTDRQLIYFLYHRFMDDEQWCFTKKVLAQECGTSEGNIKNRISFVNQEIKRLVTKGKTSLDDFIKNEPRRGYRLNPRFVIQFTKK